MFIPLEKHPSSWPSVHGRLDTSFSVNWRNIDRRDMHVCFLLNFFRRLFSMNICFKLNLFKPHQVHQSKYKQLHVAPVIGRSD